MSTHLDRAQLLLQQSRPADAEHEAGLAVVQTPDNPQAYLLLALSRLAQDKFNPALESASTALSLAPDYDYAHYVHAVVLHRSARSIEALTAVREAIRLAPENAANFSLLASIQLNLGDKKAALSAADQALAIDPEDTDAANYRAMALIRLGRKAEAVAAVDSTLIRDPESSFSHANQGWNYLHHNNPKKALTHFKEALRLEPELDYARQGMIEALKARYTIYRWILSYFLWMQRIPSGYQWAFVIATFFASRYLNGLAASHPNLTWLWWPILGLFYTFVYLTWTASPMFNLVLRLNPYGRYLLTNDQRLGSHCFGVSLFLALIATATCIVTHSALAFNVMIFSAMFSICVAATFAQENRKRLILLVSSGTLATLALLALLPQILSPSAPVWNGIATLFVYGFIGFQILANILARR